MCTLAEKENDEVFGTGGEILRSLQRLMGHLAGLRDIELVDLLLERVEGMYALDQVRLLRAPSSRVWVISVRVDCLLIPSLLDVLFRCYWTLAVGDDLHDGK